MRKSSQCTIHHGPDIQAAPAESYGNLPLHYTLFEKTVKVLIPTEVKHFLKSKVSWTTQSTFKRLTLESHKVLFSSNIKVLLKFKSQLSLKII